MSGISRRRLLQATTAGAALAAFAPVGRSRAADGARIIVAGGGFGGATCARYLKKLAPSARVTLIDRQREFVTGPFCNTVVAGIHPMAKITHDHTALAKAGIEFIQSDVARIDPGKRSVRLADGSELTGERVVVSPGISFRWDAIEGYGPKVAETVTHAWPGSAAQLATLRDQLKSMPDNGTVAIAVPANPYRCPPGPYERASLIAHYLQNYKMRAKILILDAKDTFSKQNLFRTGWAEHYGERVEWVGRRDGGRVTAVAAAGKALVTADGEQHTADVINMIPPQAAGKLAIDADLTDASGWAPVDHRSFESTRHAGIHVLGDACQAGPMPKSAYAANAQAKICAWAIAAQLAGEDFGGSRLINACYSFVTPDYGISVTEVYGLNGAQLAALPAAGGLSPLAATMETRAKEADYARSWYRNIIADSFG